MAILGAVVRLRNCFGVYSSSAKLLISIFYLIQTFDFDLILDFFGPLWAFLGGSGYSSKLFLGLLMKLNNLYFP